MQRSALRVVNRLRDLLYAPGTARMHLKQARDKIACLLYHRVVDLTEDRFCFLTRGGVPAISPRELASDISFLRQKGAKFFTFEDLQDGRFPKRGEFGVIICFDDCFRDNYEAGRAVLEAHGVRGVFFQTSGLVDRCELLWEHMLYWCCRDRADCERIRQLGCQILNGEHAASLQCTRDPISFFRDRVPFEQTQAVLTRASAEAHFSLESRLPGVLYPSRHHVRAARVAGHEIGSHGHEHLMRVNISSRVFENDLARSCDVLADLLGEVPRSYAYPFSSHLPGDERICAKFFNMAAVVERKQRIEKDTNPYLMPRFTWPGPARNRLRQRRWLLSGTI
jgi:peptidoglycan/xylan/chitin deacetylase (PgdA/CDA1 family)